MGRVGSDCRRMFSGSLQRQSVALRTIVANSQRVMVASMYPDNVGEVSVVLQDRVRCLVLVMVVCNSAPQHRSSLLKSPESCVLFLQTPRLFLLFHVFYVLMLILAARLRCFGTYPRNMYPGLNTGNVFCTRQAAGVGL